ncbi:hypothetical protein BDY19DRAFT_991631 [Irpex rosettiformis]|uniref:Uncharacterized protein n=1 Tax=Irpex rosettiformis TaxID=378272 RepID=A0ACB8UA48_9APHY|nr:hypothetical protein BDY19DRAFT_991631 [Irpex rosettiformis]
MDRTWVKVHGFIPLVRCMPPEVVVETHVEQLGSGIVTEIHFSREPTLTDWKMFRKHAHRVKHFRGSDQWTIGHPQTHQVKLSKDACRTISYFLEHLETNGDMDSYLFPTLLSYTDIAVDLFPNSIPKYSLRICGGTLQSFQLHSGFGTPSSLEVRELYCDIADSLLSLCSNWPYLRTFDVACYSTPAWLEGAHNIHLKVNLLLSRLRGLQTFAFGLPLDREAIIYLSNLPNLHSLTLKLRFDPSFSSPLQLSSLSFASLRELTVTYSAPENIIVLLEGLRDSRSLKKLNIFPITLPEDQGCYLGGFRQLLDVVSSILSVQELWISVRNGRNVALSGKLLAILFSLSQMDYFGLYGVAGTTLSDSDLQAMAAAWPKLTRFSCLTATPDIQNGANLSLFGIQELCNRCPRLKTAEIGMWSLGSLSSDSVRTVTPGENSLEKSILGLANNIDDRELADTLERLIHVLFPQISYFDVWPIGH